MSKLTHRWAQVGGGLAVLCMAAAPSSVRSDPPLFQYTPPRAGTMAGTLGEPTTPAAGATSVVASAAPAQTSSVNILVLALDESDIAAARINNITSLLPGAEPKNTPLPVEGLGAVPAPQ